jgi:oligopeptide transport system substrate-binding protein
VAELFGAGYVPACSLVPPGEGYAPPRTLPVSIDGRIYDVLSFDLPAARDLLSRIAKPLPARIEYIVGDSPDDMLWAQVLKQQWRAALGIELAILPVEFQTWIESFHTGKFRHLANGGSSAFYMDPVWFLDLFNRPDGYGTHWQDPEYLTILNQAKATADPALRLSRLARCERRLLGAMPILPVANWVDAVLKKPFVRGIGNNLLGRQQFKYVWIDSDWRPS